MATEHAWTIDAEAKATGPTANAFNHTARAEIKIHSTSDTDMIGN